MSNDIFRVLLGLGIIVMGAAAVYTPIATGSLTRNVSSAKNDAFQR